ncbi:hypothetical protein EV580_1332 [Mycobacterium sp. BK086]|uniref:hypothetical protein n=1 Tax=Mycobacterium sp. BK086 TaxID=2512165 RepID=UPI0010E6C0B5|nr:hypothetical protein [Mycobacterium sp. BK086]TDO18150.1 hypothetical protein EV580_1332 [Mycobacterium sp. BK086]
MTATEHSHRAWVLVDPVQDYEESLTILGVYRSDRTARYAARAHIRREPHRDLEAQERRGADLLRVWTWSWRDRHWTLCYRNPIRPCHKHNHAEVENVAASLSTSESD